MNCVFSIALEITKPSIRAKEHLRTLSELGQNCVRDLTFSKLSNCKKF